MTELEKWESVNRTETVPDLKKAVEEICKEGLRISSGELWTVNKHLSHIDRVVKGESLRLVTRKYGIRQQLFYLLTR